MTVSAPDRGHTTHVVLDIGQDVGALVVYTSHELLGREIEVSPRANAARRTHTDVLERPVNGRATYAAVFAGLPAGAYSLWRDVMTDVDVTIAGGSIAEVNWRDVTEAEDFRLARPEGMPAPRYGEAGARRVPVEMLPSRYRDGGQANPAPMGSAPLCYTSDGTVAWDQMWTQFCDLALAGGPRHRDTLLEPATPEQAAADPTSYEHVVSEIQRGFALVSELPFVRGDEPGWVGLRCDDETMARWMVCAIAEENVSVRRKGDAIFLPAAPHFTLAKEIKNVVTVVAKTNHYWLEHRFGQAEHSRP